MRRILVFLRMGGEQCTTSANDGTIIHCKAESCVPIVVLGVTVVNKVHKAMQMRHRETDRRLLRKTESKIFQTGFIHSRKD